MERNCGIDGRACPVDNRKSHLETGPYVMPASTGAKEKVNGNHHQVEFDLPRVRICRADGDTY